MMWWCHAVNPMLVGWCGDVRIYTMFVTDFQGLILEFVAK